MKIEISTKNYNNLKDDLRELIIKKVNKLEKYFDKDAEAKVLLKMDNKMPKFEISIVSNGLFFRSEVTADNMYECLDLALPKLEKQIVKSTDKYKTIIRHNSIQSKEFAFLSKLPELEEKVVVKKKTYELEPITVEDAMTFLENIGNNFYIFLNRETGNVNVLYRRNDGNFGLIEAIY